MKPRVWNTGGAVANLYYWFIFRIFELPATLGEGLWAMTVRFLSHQCLLMCLKRNSGQVGGRGIWNGAAIKISGLLALFCEISLQSYLSRSRNHHFHEVDESSIRMPGPPVLYMYSTSWLAYKRLHWSSLAFIIYLVEAATAASNQCYKNSSRNKLKASAIVTWCMNLQKEHNSFLKIQWNSYKYVAFCCY